MGLLRPSRGGRAWEQPQPELEGPFWNPRKAGAQGLCLNQGLGPAMLLPVPINVSCHSSGPKMAAPAALVGMVTRASEYQGGLGPGLSCLQGWAFPLMGGSGAGKMPEPRDRKKAGDAGRGFWMREMGCSDPALLLVHRSPWMSHLPLQSGFLIIK